MILVDTSVWIDHMRQPNRTLSAHLEERNVLCHEMVIGELACGNLRSRETTLRDLKALPLAETPAGADVLALIEDRRLMGRGIGYVDANLISAVLADGSATLWTTDLKLRRVAKELGIAHNPDSEDS